MQNCRICNSSNTEKFNFDHEIFPSKRNKYCDNYFCMSCKSISHFYKKKINLYKDYRLSGTFIENKKKIKPPISLPWSLITFRRSKNIIKVLRRNLKLKKFSHLDYGGYNGLLPYSLNQFFKVKSTVADYEKDGLEFAKKLGCRIINLKNQKIKKKYDFISMVHVFEHLDNPRLTLKNLSQNCKINSYIYVETPNMFAVPLYDPTHLLSANLNALEFSLESVGFRVLEKGYTSTPKEALDFGYPFISEKENIYVFAQKVKNFKIRLNFMKYPKNSKQLVKNLSRSYFVIIINSIISRKINNIYKDGRFLIGSILISFLRLFLKKK